MNPERRNKITNLLVEQKEKRLVQYLESHDFTTQRICSSNHMDLLWSNINRGHLLERTEELNLESLMSNIRQLFAGARHLGTVIDYKNDQFIVYFEAAEFIERAEGMIHVNSKDALLNWFVFSADKDKICWFLKRSTANMNSCIMKKVRSPFEMALGGLY